MIPEEDLVPISALQHLLFCERQWALIHLEGAWAENRFTAGGRILHERVHGSEAETRRDLRVCRGLALRSLQWGLIGKSDVVEFYRLPEGLGAGVSLPGRKGRWQPFPVEYKAGKPKIEWCDEVQLCAQALCLEEMLGVAVPRGALFYGRPHQRTECDLGGPLRQETERVLGRLRELLEGRDRPRGRFDRKCESCSLADTCLPRLGRQPRSARAYVEDLFLNPSGGRS